jgi:cell division protein FtsI (penicillin-binding protein 3)
MIFTKIFLVIKKVITQFCCDSGDTRDLVSINSIFAWDIRSESAKLRLILVTCCFCFCFCLLGYRLIIVATNNEVKINRYIKNNIHRKEIVDRNGNLLASNIPSTSLFANPQKVINPEQCLDNLKILFPDINNKKLLAELKSDKSFVWIKRDLSPKEQSAILNLGLPGFAFESEQKRIYTFGNLLSHVIGYVGRDFSGLAGLERYYDKFLNNQDVLNSRFSNDKSLELSIDVRLQNILSEEIDKTLKEFRAVAAVGIIADPHSGEILALVNKPDFDPHNPSSATTEELFNRASLGIYETGSVFKSLTMAIGFDTNSIKYHDAYDITYMRIGRFAIKDYHPRAGWNTVPEIFLHSSNIGVSQIMLEVGKDNLKKYLKKLGLLDQLQIELPERGTPLFPSDSRWSDLSTATMSYGYALAISPLHFIQAMLPVVNGGYLHKLTLVKKDVPDKGVKVFEKSTSDEMKKLFRLVVKEGTGKKADVKGYLIGGKTGTAEKLTGKHYAKNSRRSSFFGVLPASNPKYVIYIMFDEPKGTKESFGFATAGWTAAPTVGRVFERMITLYGLGALDENDREVQNIMNLEYKIDGGV